MTGPESADRLGDAPDYRRRGLSPAERTRDLLSRMTLEEKAGQMMCVWNEKATTLVDERGAFDPGKAARSFSDGIALGQVGRPSDAGGGVDARGQAILTNAIQRFFLENTRLGIPVVFHEECLHGQAAPGGTSFPQPIGIASAFDPDLVERLYAMTAREARLRGTHHALTPVVDVARDPRWGRVEETFGEDPWLIAHLGVAAVRGFQGDGSFATRDRIMATLKHFAAHGQPEGGMNCAPANVSERELRDVFLFPFRKAVEAGVASLMASYNEIDGVPSHANRWLLRDVLRGEWGFTGFIVSDYYAIWELNDRPDTHAHMVAADKREAAVLGVRAGVNIELPEPDCYRHLVELVREGRLSESELDDLVAPMLEWKFRMRLFDDPYVDPDEAERVVGCDAHRDLAREAADKSIVLLKNEAELLPLAPTGTIAVIGPNADRSLLGGYSGKPPVDVSVLEGIRSRVGHGGRILYAQGCAITVGGAWNEDVVTLPEPDDDRRMIAEAVEVARKADVVVLALGGNEQTSREAWSRVHMGDRTDLDLFGAQNELVAAIAATGKPIVALLFNGRPLAVTRLAETAGALVECWYPGQECGHAVAGMLFGDTNPSGKLPISFPRSAGHLPVFYNHKPSARRGYLFDEVTPLFPFGFGLSYTTFSIANARLDDATIGVKGSTRVHVEVTNTGRRAGSETIQLYIRDRASSVTRPVKELKGFARVDLDPGATKTVTLDVTPECLAFHDVDYVWRVEPGAFDLRIGTSSRDHDLLDLELTVL